MANVNIKQLKKPVETTIMLHSADPKLSLNHIEYWLPVLENSKVVFSVLLRDKASFKKVKSKHPSLQLLYAKSPVDVETVVNAQPNLKTVLYPSNMAKNIHLLRFIDLKHVFIGTKHSDRLSKINKSYRAYDEIWVSSQSQIDKFHIALDETRHLQFKIIGKPWLKETFKRTYNRGKEDTICYLYDNEDLPYELFAFMKQEARSRHIIYSRNKSTSKLIDSLKKNELSTLKLEKSEDIFFYASDLKYIIVTPNQVSQFLLALDVPIFVFVEEDTECMELQLPKECLYFFSNAEKLKSLAKSVEANDELREKREYFSEYFLGKSMTKQDVFYKEIKSE